MASASSDSRSFRTLSRGFAEVLAVLGEDANAVVGGRRLNPDEGLLVLGSIGRTGSRWASAVAFSG